jgi:predicted enzyme related to lactoylglutathione lyase
MTGNKFCRYTLQTTDLTPARAFYADVVDEQLWGSGVSLAALPERAAAHGAPAHWLGHIAVADVADTTRYVVDGGGQQLGPLRQGRDGSSFAALRDPFGAVMAVSSERTISERSPVAWHLLNSSDHERAFAFYAAQFAWTASGPVEQMPGMGEHQRFAWDESARSVGSVASSVRLPEVHPHWLFFFRVADLEGALAKVRARGGKALDPATTSNGDRFAACDDPQGAAFGLYSVAQLKL